MKLSKQVTNDVRTSNVTNIEGMEAQDHTELKKIAISNGVSSNKQCR